MGILNRSRRSDDATVVYTSVTDTSTRGDAVDGEKIYAGWEKLRSL